MATFTLFDEFINNVHVGNIDMDTISVSFVLTNTAPVPATDDELADITEISGGGGYTAGGTAVSGGVTWEETGAGTGIWRLKRTTQSDLVLVTASGNVATYRYVVFYDDTSTGDKLIGYIDHGSAIDLTATDTHTLDWTGAPFAFFTVSEQ